MTLDEQLAWLPKLERMRSVLSAIFGKETELTPLWDESETWYDCAERTAARRYDLARRRTGDSSGRSVLHPVVHAGRRDAPAGQLYLGLEGEA